jgi:hypothetical protein
VLQARSFRGRYLVATVDMLSPAAALEFELDARQTLPPIGQSIHFSLDPTAIQPLP